MTKSEHGYRLAGQASEVLWAKDLYNGSDIQIKCDLSGSHLHSFMSEQLQGYKSCISLAATVQEVYGWNTTIGINSLVGMMETMQSMFYLHV